MTLQWALRELRRHGGLTRPQLAVHMRVGEQTIRRWETVRSPRGTPLLRLVHVARELGRPDLAELFESEAFRSAQSAGEDA